MKDETDIEATESIPSKETCKNRKCDQFVRIVATIVCLILFFANSFVIFKQCISGKTIVFSDFNEKAPESLREKAVSVEEDLTDAEKEHKLTLARLEWENEERSGF